jgi:glycosyltransferase involved in cell wall biosynthesis
VTWADEIIVVDSGSTDQTRRDLPRTRRPVNSDSGFSRYGQQKNRALDRTTGDWVLALDHDEWVSAELRAEIEATIKNPVDAVAFTMPRLSSYCGRNMRHAGWWPDPVTRLFRKSATRCSKTTCTSAYL